MKTIPRTIPLTPPDSPCPVSNSSRPSPHYRPGDGRRRSPALPAAPASPQTKHSAIHGQPSLSRDASLRHKRSYRNLSYERVLPKIPRTHRQMPHPDPTPPHANEVTMKRYTRISQTHQYAQQSHRIGTTAQSDQNRTILG